MNPDKKIIKRTYILVILSLSLFVSCGDRAELWEQPLVMLGPYKVGAEVMWVDSTRGRVYYMEPGGSQPVVAQMELRRNAVFALSSHDDLLVLSRGKEAVLKDQVPEEPGLTLVAPGPRERRFYPLSGAFDRIAVSPSGTYAVAYYSANQTSQEILRNPNEVALLDLTQDPGPENPVLRTVRSFGSAPLGVIFSPEMNVPPPEGPSRTLAVVLAENYLTFLDMNNRSRSEITVPLTKPDAATTVTPREVLFSQATGTVFVRADGAADIFAISLLPRDPQAESENDYLPSINQPSSGKIPLDMLIFAEAGKDEAGEDEAGKDEAGKDWVLTANASGDLSLIDAASSQFAVIPLGEPIDTLVGVPAQNPKMVLAYSQSAPSPRIHFLNLADLQQGLGDNVVSRRLDQPVHQVVVTPDDLRALVVHDDQRTVISVLDLVGQHHTVSPIQGRLPLESFDFLQGVESSFLVGASRRALHLGLMDMSNLHPFDFRLDYAPHEVLVVGANIVVDHGTRDGCVTVIPGVTAQREESHVLWGLFSQNLLDKKLED